MCLREMMTQLHSSANIVKRGGVGKRSNKWTWGKARASKACGWQWCLQPKPMPANGSIARCQCSYMG